MVGFHPHFPSLFSDIECLGHAKRALFYLLIPFRLYSEALGIFARSAVARGVACNIWGTQDVDRNESERHTVGRGEGKIACG